MFSKKSKVFIDLSDIIYLTVAAVFWHLLFHQNLYVMMALGVWLMAGIRFVKFVFPTYGGWIAYGMLLLLIIVSFTF